MFHSYIVFLNLANFSDTDSADANRYTGYIAYQHSDNAMIFYTNGGGERMRIKADGHVGIGTSNPTVNLDVNSTVQETREEDVKNIEIELVNTEEKLKTHRLAYKLIPTTKNELEDFLAH